MFPQQQQQPQRKPIMAPAIASQNEAQAKEKLSGYVYEYLIHVGAPKAAEIFKSEILAHQNLTQIAPGEPPGFLHNWWCVFWDLYSAAPERRDKYDPSQEAKAFHEYGFIPPSVFPPNHMMNGIHPASQFGNGSGPGINSMAIPNPSDAIIPNYFANRNNNQSGPSNNQSNQASPIAAGGRYVGAHPGVGVPSGAGARSGAPTPSSVMGAGPNGPNFAGPPGMFSADQMRNIAVQRMNSNTRIPNFGPMRQVMRSGGFGPGPTGPFLESPSGTPPFGQNPGMIQNGMCPTASLMSSPNNQQSSGPSVPHTLNPEGSTHDPRFMMMSGAPTQFSMNHHDGAGTPTSCASNNNFNNNGMQLSANNTNSSDSNNPSVSGMGGQLQSLLNGGDGVSDIKHSPVSHINGGTPAGGHTNPNSIQQQLGGGPASVHGCHGDPGSVQSQSGVGAPGSVLGNAGPNSQQPVQPHQTPTSEPSQTSSMDFQPPAPATNSSGGDDEMEISKIKASLIEGFGPGSGSFGPV